MRPRGAQSNDEATCNRLKGADAGVRPFNAFCKRASAGAVPMISISRAARE
jgi:hypothetical protein